jgi:surface polysaccharide O-acyltransferase-like enzyme
MAKQFNQTIINMGTIGALLIVLLHISPISDVPWQNAIIDFVYHKSDIVGVAVPLFFCISGYLLVGHANESDWWKNALKKRVKSLLIPFLVWTFILLTIKTIYYALTFACGMQLVTPNPAPNGITYLILECVGLDIFHLTPIVWYLRTLFLYVMVSPLIVWAIRRSKVTVICLFIALVLINRYGPYNPTACTYINEFLANGLYCDGLLYFALGIYLQIRPIKSDVIKRFTSPLKLALGGGILLIINYIAPSAPISYLLKVTMLAIIYTIAKCIKFPAWINGLSMPLYLIHITVSWTIAFMLNILDVYYLHHLFAFWPIKYILIVSITIFMASIMRTRFPKLYSFLFAGRG